jgi:NADPH-dependent 2,4-dienoyl-CoA reductase/sulfur reductase-like enzyme
VTARPALGERGALVPNGDVVADVVVVGAGPAGMAAAVAAAGAGRRVAVLDAGFGPGGQIWRHTPGTRPERAARRWVDALTNARPALLFNTSVVDLRRRDDGGFTLRAERGTTPVGVVAGRVVLATGARERMLPFPGWTLPGVVGLGGAQALLKMGTPVAGLRVVVAGSGPLVLPVAASLARAGARVVLVAEQAGAPAVARFAAGLWRRPALLARAARYRAAFARTRYATGTWVTAAEGAGRVERVTVTDGRRARALDCDLLCVAYGLVPSTELARLVGCATAGGAVVVDDDQQSSVPGIFCAGEPTGIAGADLALVEGEIAGLAAAGHAAAARARRLRPARERLRAAAEAMERAFAPRAELRDACTDATVVCRCEDVTRGALDPAWCARQAKLYTRAGMGPCQGRVCGAALEFLFGWTPDTVRAPIEPILLSTLLADAAPDAAPLDHGAA